jgi:hypothetical protein
VFIFLPRSRLWLVRSESRDVVIRWFAWCIKVVLIAWLLDIVAVVAVVFNDSQTDLHRWRRRIRGPHRMLGIASRVV